MVDVRRDDGAATCDLVAHEFGRDVLGDRGAEALAVSNRSLGAGERGRAAEVLAVRDVDHLFRDDAGAGELELRDGLARQAAQGLRLVGEVARQVRARHVAVVLGPDVAALVGLDAAAFADPGFADARQALLDVDGRVGIGVGTGGIVHAEGFLARFRRERDLAEGHAHIRKAFRRGIDLARRADGAGRHFRRHELVRAGDLVHGLGLPASLVQV